MKTSEMITMMEDNPKLEFCDSRGRLATVTEGILEIAYRHANTPFYINEEWSVVNTNVSFIEAVKSGKRFKYCSWNTFYDIDQVLKTLSTLIDEDKRKRISSDNWYIEMK